MERGQRKQAARADRDQQWLDEGIAWQFELPPKRPHLFFRWWGVRHIRAAWMWVWAHIMPATPDWHELWRREWVSYAIFRGWC